MIRQLWQKVGVTSLTSHFCKSDCLEAVGYFMGQPMGGCWPSWVLHASPSGCGYLPFCASDLCGWLPEPVGLSIGCPVGVGCMWGRVYLLFCGSDLCGWVLIHLGSLWVTQWVWVPTILWVLISVGGCWPSWVVCRSPSGCGYLPFCGSNPWVGVDPVWVPRGLPSRCGWYVRNVYLPFYGLDLCEWVFTQLGSLWVAQ